MTDDELREAAVEILRWPPDAWEMSPPAQVELQHALAILRALVERETERCAVVAQSHTEPGFSDVLDIGWKIACKIRARAK